MSELALRPLPCGSRAPEIDTPPNEVNLSKEDANTIDSKLLQQGICTSCQKITLDRLLMTHCGSVGACWLEFKSGQPINCPMCRMILKSINLGDENTGIIRLGLRVDDPQPKTDIYTGRRIRDVRVTRDQVFAEDYFADGLLRIYADPDSYVSKFGPRMCIPSSNLSDATFQNISSWIKVCDETHTSCWNLSWQSSEAETRYLPTRVVHVGSKTQQPRLHISHRHQNDRYIALSHCWGNIPQVRTLKANIGLFKEEIILCDLSKSFQDAIHASRRLNIEYIWIDSLCIVQDDDVDWLRESERMGGIYANAYITIAATWTPDGSGGLDSIRPRSNWIRIPCDRSNEAKGDMWLTDASWTSRIDLDDAPLNMRGWVLQEKMLSRRIIHFASSQVYWGCKQRFVGQESEDEIHFKGATMEPPVFWADVNAISRIGPLRKEDLQGFHRPDYSTRSQLHKFYYTWRSFARYYGTRSLTKQSDRLIALRGIIRVVEKQTGLRCIEGHWDDGSYSFMCELMWFSKEKRTLPVLDDGRRSRLCSSWSWASLEGLVEYDFSFDGCEGDPGMNYDRGLRLQAIGDRVYIPWSSRPLKVSGVLRSVYKCELKWGYEYQDRRTFPVKARSSVRADGRVYLDREDEELAKVRFSPVHIHNRNIACLALVERHRPESTERCFERVGMGHIYQTSSCNDSGLNVVHQVFEACERETFYII